MPADPPMGTARVPAGDVVTAPSRSVLPRVVNNFIHDMSTGTWAACVLVIWIVWSQGRGVPAAAAAVLTDAALAVFWLLLLSLVGLAVTGGIRVSYWRADTPAEQLKAKRGALIVKHVAFLVVYGIGSVLAAWMVFGG